MCALLGLSQSLVSYHLGLLSDQGLIERRRSSADGRDSYYVLNLERTGTLLADAGGALHPGLGLTTAVTRYDAAAGTRILFLCTGNSARSQIAEALAGQLTSGAVLARSAGSHPKPLHPHAVRALAERAIDIEGARTKHLDEFTSDSFDYVVSLCDRVREVCPEFPGHPATIHWSVADPAWASGDERAVYAAFVRTVDELAVRIRFLLALIAASRSMTES